MDKEKIQRPPPGTNFLPGAGFSDYKQIPLPFALVKSIQKKKRSKITYI